MKEIKYPHINSQRVDNFLFSCFRSIPRALIYRLIRKKNIKLNGKATMALNKIKQNDYLSIPDFLFAQLKGTQTDYQYINKNKIIQLKKLVVYEDEYLLILNKPSNLAVHSGSNNQFGLIEIFKQQYPDYELAHRLDKQTTGCLLMGKNRKITNLLHQIFRDKLIDKYYLALCYGHIDKKINKINLPIFKSNDVNQAKVMIDFQKGKKAITYIRKAQWLKLPQNFFNKHSKKYKDYQGNFDPFSLIYLQLASGKTHQIRIHLAHLNHPIVGDEKYNQLNNQFNYVNLALMLHCQKLVFNHPVSNEKIKIEIQPNFNQFNKLFNYLEYSKQND